MLANYISFFLFLEALISEVPKAISESSTKVFFDNFAEKLSHFRVLCFCKMLFMFMQESVKSLKH